MLRDRKAKAATGEAQMFASTSAAKLNRFINIDPHVFTHWKESADV